MSVLEYIRTLWPIAVVLLPFVCATGFIWLKTQFPTRVDLDGVEKRLGAKIDDHDDRLDRGSKAMAELDKRTALVEDECKAVPSRQNLQTELSSIAQRTRGVEVEVAGMGRELGTLNSYLHTLIERGINGSQSK